MDTCPLAPDASRLISGFCSSPRDFALSLPKHPASRRRTCPLANLRLYIGLESGLSPDWIRAMHGTHVEAVRQTPAALTWAKQGNAQRRGRSARAPGWTRGRSRCHRAWRPESHQGEETAHAPRRRASPAERTARRGARAFFEDLRTASIHIRLSVGPAGIQSAQRKLGRTRAELEGECAR